MSDEMVESLTRIAFDRLLTNKVVNEKGEFDIVELAEQAAEAALAARKRLSCPRSSEESIVATPVDQSATSVEQTPTQAEAFRVVERRHKRQVNEALAESDA